eukprot:7456911-Pyramimonas_sp.AAC.1
MALGFPNVGVTRVPHQKHNCSQITAREKNACHHRTEPSASCLERVARQLRRLHLNAVNYHFARWHCEGGEREEEEAEEEEE